jgi:hypothetical protein
MAVALWQLHVSLGAPRPLRVLGREPGTFHRRVLGPGWMSLDSTLGTGSAREGRWLAGILVVPARRACWIDRRPVEAARTVPLVGEAPPVARIAVGSKPFVGEQDRVIVGSRQEVFPLRHGTGHDRNPGGSWTGELSRQSDVARTAADLVERIREGRVGRAAEPGGRRGADRIAGGTAEPGSAARRGSRRTGPRSPAGAI